MPYHVLFQSRYGTKLFLVIVKMCVPSLCSPFWLLQRNFVLREDATIEKIENTRILQDISRRVPYLVLFNSFGPEFEAHAKRQFKELANIRNYENVADIEKCLRESGIEFYDFRLPSYIGESLSKGHNLKEYCSQFMICSFNALPEMLNQVKQVIRACLRRRKPF